MIAADKKYLLSLARKTLQAYFSQKKLSVSAPPAGSPLSAPRGCFVTLQTRSGQLCGCVGNIEPSGPLYLAVQDNSLAAALADDRFLPLTETELAEIKIEISVLTEPRFLSFSSPDDLLNQLRSGRPGVILSQGRQSATYLPQVWEVLPEPEVFLSSLSEKAGLKPMAWHEPDTRIAVYEAEHFVEA